MIFLHQDHANHTTHWRVGCQKGFVGLGSRLAIDRAIDRVPTTPLPGALGETDLVLAVLARPAATGTVPFFRFGGKSRRAASRRKRPITVTPVFKARFKNGRLVSPPSTTIQTVFPALFMSGVIHSTNRAANWSLVAKRRQRRHLGIDASVC